MWGTWAVWWPRRLEGSLSQVLGSAGCWAGSGDLRKVLKQEIMGEPEIQPSFHKMSGALCLPPLAVFSFLFFNEELDQPFPQWSSLILSLHAWKREVLAFGPTERPGRSS